MCLMEETMSSELEFSELRKQSIRQTLDLLHDRASSILMLTLRLKEIEEHFEPTHNAVEDSANELLVIQESVEQNLEEVKKREKELEVVRESVNARLEEIVAREKEFESSQRKEIEEKRIMIEWVDKSRRELEVICDSIERKLRELKDVEKKFELFDITIQEKADEIRVFDREVNERLAGIEVKEKECEHFFSALKVKEKQVEERSKELALKDEHFSRQCIELQLKEGNLGKQDTELKLKVEKTEERFRVLELKEKQIQTRCEEMELENKKLVERCEELALKEKQLESRRRELQLDDMEFSKGVKQFELKERELEESVKKFYLKEKQLVNGHMTHVKIEPPQSHGVNIHLSAPMDGKSLQMFLNDHCEDHDLMRNTVLNALRLSSDPAKLVLDAMEGFYPPNLKKGDLDFEEAVVRRSCIVLLEQLKSISPEIRPDITKEATRLARDWMRKMKVDTKHSLEVLGFLQLLATYGLASVFDTDELLTCLGTVAQHTQAPELFRFLGLTEKISEFLQNLISKNQHIEAIRFIYAFEKVNEFPPAPLLEKYLEDSKSSGRSIQAEIEATNKRIINIRAALRCIEDDKIESKQSPEKLKQQNRCLEDANSLREALLAAKPPYNENKCFAPQIVAAASCSLAPQSESIRSPAPITPTKGSTTGPSSSPPQQQSGTKRHRTAVSVKDYPSALVGAASAVTTPSSSPIANSTTTAANTAETITSSPATAIVAAHITTSSPLADAPTAASAFPSATTVSTVAPITAASISLTVGSRIITIPETGTDDQISKKRPRIVVSSGKPQTTCVDTSRIVHPRQPRLQQPASQFMVNGAPCATAIHYDSSGYPPLYMQFSYPYYNSGYYWRP